MQGLRGSHIDSGRPSSQLPKVPGWRSQPASEDQGEWPPYRSPTPYRPTLHSTQDTSISPRESGLEVVFPAKSQETGEAAFCFI